MNSPQSKISLEQDAVKICLTIHRYDGVAWEPIDICNQLSMSAYRFAECYTWLLDNVYVYEAHGVINLTDEGNKYIDSLAISTSIGNPADTMRHKEESLTGFVEKWNPKVRQMSGVKSKLKNAVLQTGKQTHEMQIPDDAMAEMDKWIRWKERLCKQLKIDDETLVKYMAEGRIHICKKCDKPGILRKNGHGGWEQPCRECRKAVTDEKS